jgi:hypothetical protein
MFNSHNGKVTESVAAEALRVAVVTATTDQTAVELKRSTGISKSHVARLLDGFPEVICIERGGRLFWRSQKKRTKVQRP